MSNETKQAVYDAAQRFVSDASSTAELESTLAAHLADEKPKPKAKAKPAAKPPEGDKDLA